MLVEFSKHPQVSLVRLGIMSRLLELLSPNQAFYFTKSYEFHHQHAERFSRARNVLWESIISWTIAVSFASLVMCARANDWWYWAECQIIALLNITQFGNKVGAGAFQGRAVPTYIYNDPIKTVVREVIDFAFCMYPKTKTNVNCHPPFQCSAEN